MSASIFTPRYVEPLMGKGRHRILYRRNRTQGFSYSSVKTQREHAAVCMSTLNIAYNFVRNSSSAYPRVMKTHEPSYFNAITLHVGGNCDVEPHEKCRTGFFNHEVIICGLDFLKIPILISREVFLFLSIFRAGFEPNPFSKQLEYNMREQVKCVAPHAPSGTNEK